MGQPSSPEGGLIKRDWLDTWRFPAAPQRPVYTVVGVDPCDSGSGDSCGIVAASLTGDGTVAVIADASAPMTSDQWARAAVELAVDIGASEIAIEAFAARETYLRVVKEALARYKLGRPIRATAWPPKGSGRGGGDAWAEQKPDYIPISKSERSWRSVVPLWLARPCENRIAPVFWLFFWACIVSFGAHIVILIHAV